MDILSYLSALIQTRKTVGIAGLGTVLKVKTPGRFDAETHSFVPPSYTIDFTAELREETSLADYISKKRNVSADTANYFINEFSTALQQQLDEGKEVSLGDLGLLSKSDGELNFKPATEKTYGFDFFGLPAVKEEAETPIEEIISETPEVTEPESQVPEVSTDAPAAPVADHLPEEVIREETDETPDTTETTQPEESLVPEVSVVPEASTPAPEAVPQPIAPAEEPTLASVAAENEGLEENPGDHAEQLQEEIESLNFYRSKLPYLKENGPADEEVIFKLNDPETELPKPVVPVMENRFIEPNIPYSPLPVEEAKVFPAYLKIILVSIIILLMMSALYLFKPEWFSGITGKHTDAQQSIPAATIPAASTLTPDSTAVKDSTDHTTVTPVPVRDTLQETANKAISQQAAPADTTTLYEIIGASMHDQKEADAFIAQMKKSGIHAKVVTNMSGKRLKISIATLKDEKTANLERERLTQKLKIPGIYIYRNKQ